MKNMKKFASLGLSLVMMLSLAACGGSKTPAASGSAAPAGSADGSAAAAESDLEYVKGKGKLVVGITDFAPMDYKDKDGKWIGFDADNATAFAKSLGVDVEFIEVDWDNKIMELDSKSIDCVWNGMTLTDEVKNSMETSKPYCENAQVVVVKAADADKYKDTDSLKDLKFAAEAGSAGAAEVKKLGLKCTELTTQADALMEVQDGTSDACVIDLLMAGAMIGEGTSYPDMKLGDELTTEEYGVGFRKGSDLVQKLNDFFKASYADGSMLKIAETYGVQAAVIEQK